MPPDFSRLYRDLGLQPDCSLDAFRRAYRVLVSRQHPDRPAVRSDGAGALALSELIALHDQALQFHRQHGRLPGAPLPVVTGPSATGSGVLAEALHPRGTDTAKAMPKDAAPAAQGAHRQAWLAVGVLVLIAIGVSQPQGPARMPRGAGATPAAVLGDEGAAPHALAIGMDADTARSIQGEPMRVSGGEWEYGPSWLRFERGALVDWYSSPLRPLKVPTPDAPEPPPRAAASDAP